jgi:ribosomal protein S18 acetylase RimI-like enzyme
MRELRATDLPALTLILHQCEAFTEVEIACALELLEIVINEPQQQDYRVAVSEGAGEVLGYILYGPVPLTEGTYDIYWIAVDPNCQGQGIGQQLMIHAERQAKAARGRMICLETSSQGHYERTREFYRQAGYLEESRIRDFYRPGDDRLTYVKRFTTMEES